MKTLLIIFTTVLLGIFIHTSMRLQTTDSEELVPNNPGWFNYYLLPISQLLSGSFTHLLTTVRHITAFDLVILTIKYVPLSIYALKFARSFYYTSKERMLQKQMEIEDIELQINIVNAKISARESEVEEQAMQLQESADQLRDLRARVHNLIASDDTFKKMLADSETYNLKFVDNSKSAPNSEQGCDLIKTLFKNLSQKTQNVSSEKLKDGVYCEWNETEPAPTGTSVYSSISDEDKRDCQVKIVKVTNVFKVAYLKNYIKQTRLRRAAKHAVLVKKVEEIKKMLKHWNKTLGLVTGHDLSRNNDIDQSDKSPHHGMGNSKPSLGQVSDTDSELKEPFDLKEDTYNLIMNLPTSSPYKMDLDCSDEKPYDLINSKGDFEEPSYLPVLQEETCSQIDIQTYEN